MSILDFAMGGVLWRSIGGQPTSPEEQEPTIRLDVNLTLLHAAVVDHAGQYVAGLDQRDFQLLVDGAPRAITVFEPRRCAGGRWHPSR